MRDVYARGLAVALAFAAADALVGIYHRPEPRETGQKTEDRTNRAYRIAICTAVPPCQDKKQNECHCGDDEGRQAPEPHIGLIENIAVGPLGQKGQQIVDPSVHRSEKVGGDTAIGAVRREQGDERSDASHHSHDEQHQHSTSEP